MLGGGGLGPCERCDSWGADHVGTSRAALVQQLLLHSVVTFVLAASVDCSAALDVLLHVNTYICVT
jgi:hypothetical protein